MQVAIEVKQLASQPPTGVRARGKTPETAPLLVVAPNWIGDALMAQSLLQRLHEQAPDVAIHVLAPKATARVFHYMPEVSRVWETQLAHRQLQWSARRTWAKTLRQQGYQRCYVLPNSAKSALIPWLAGIPIRIGYRGEWRYGLLTDRLPLKQRDDGGRALMFELYAALAEVRRASPKPHALPTPRLAVKPEDVTAALQAFDLHPRSHAPLIALCPGAEFGPAKRWPASHYAQLAQKALTAKPLAQIIILGSPADAAVGDEILASCASPQLRNLCGKTSLDQAIALLAAANAIVSNDSGLMHIAAALRRPQVALFGSTDPAHTPPLSPHAVVLRLGLPCSPCFKRTCPLGHQRCLVDLTPELAWDALAPMLSQEMATPSAPPVAAPRPSKTEHLGHEGRLDLTS